jgi:hypothetical protein
MRDNALSVVDRELGIGRMVDAFCDAVRASLALDATPSGR